MIKFFKRKIWFTNAFLSVTALASLVMLVVTPILGLHDAYMAMWSGIFVGSVAFYRSENNTILKAMIEKFAKENSIDVEDIYKDEGKEG